LRPIKVHAPEGSILDCSYPAPVAARHVVGTYVPIPILKALHHVIPDRVLDEEFWRGVDNANSRQVR
jgi:N-methylhydantoinase B